MGGYNRCSLICLIVSAVFVYKCCQAAGVNICGSPQKLPCDNSECISRDAWCDGKIDCVDRSDEQYCEEKGWGLWSSVPDNHCTEKHFTCADGPFIPAVARCDKNYDCSDWSDEEDCEETTTAANLGNSVPQSVETSQDNTTSSSYDNNDEDTQDKLLSRSPSMTVSSNNTKTSTTTVRPTTQRSITSTVSSRFPSSTGFYVKRSDEATVQSNVQKLYSQNRNDQYSPNYNGLPSNNYNRVYDTSLTTDNYYGQNQNGRVGYNFQKPHSSYPSGKRSDTAPSEFFPTNELSSPQPVYTPRTTTSEALDPLTFTVEDNSPKTTHKSHTQRQRPSQIQSGAALHLLSPRQQYYAYQHELNMHYREKEHDLAMKHKKELQELTMQHKIKELELSMQRKREEFELIMHHKREELELILQHKREQLELTMLHKRELDHIIQLTREE